jgi:tetratricopeptide (TPR) repeat protein/transglutaminase-like putative cysteine protease
MRLDPLPRPLFVAGAALLALLGLGVGCATTDEAGGSLPAVTPRPSPAVVASSGDEALTALVNDFYKSGKDAPLALLETRARSLAERYPDAWEVHEVLGELARLRGDDRGAWWHLLNAAADLRNRDTAFHLRSALSSSRSRSEIQTELDVLVGLAGRHPSAATRDLARAYLIGDHRELGDLRAADEVLQSFNHLNQWQLIGAFDNDQGKGFLTVYPPEESIDLDAVAQGARVDVKWRKVERLNPWGEVPIFDMVSPSKWSVAYLATWVHVANAQKAELRLSSGDPVRAWVNDRLVIDRSRVKDYAPDNLTVEVDLAKGWNKLLLKSAQETGGWSLRARLTSPGGGPIAGLQQSASPQTTPRVEGDALPPLRVYPYPAPAQPSPRDVYLQERYLTSSGRWREGLEASQAFNALSPGSRVAQRRLIVMLDVNDEAGRAIDLLNQIIDETRGEHGWFLRRRALFFHRKRQYDRAQDDLLRLLKKEPKLIRPRMDLADVYERRGFEIDRCQTIEEVLADYPDSAWAVRQKADCLMDRGFTERAYAQYAIAARLSPGHAGTTERLLNRATSTGRYEEAEAHARHLLALRPTSVGARLRVSWLAWVQGDKARARQLAEEAIALDPDDARTYRRLGDLAYEDNDIDAALNAWERALERAPNDNTLANLIDHVSTSGPGLLEELAPTNLDIEEAIANARTRPPPAGAWVQLLLDHEVTEIKNDGSSRALVTIVRHAVTKQGQDRIVRTRVPSARTKLLQAYSITPSGERQEASSIRGGVIRFRKPEIGTITVVQYLTHRGTGAFLPNHFVASWFFQGVHRAYRDSTWIVLTPESRTLNIKVYGDIEQKQEKVAGFVKRTFRATTAPVLIPEAGMPPAGDLLWRVHLTTVEDWEEYVRWERALLDNAFRSNSDLEKLAVDLTAGVTAPRAKFDKLFHYVAQEIRYQQDYENTIAGVRPHSCPVVLERGYGDCKDKAVLLILLARKVGLDVDFAILRTRNAGAVEKEIPNQQFNHAIVYVPKQEGIAEGFFMDPTVDGLDMGNLRQDDQGAISLVLDPDSGKWQFLPIPWQAPSIDATRYDVDVALLEGGGAAATIDMTLRGGFASAARKALRDSESSKRLMDTMAGVFFAGGTSTGGGPEGDPEDIWTPLKLKIEADASGAVHEEGEGTRVDLPLLFPLASSAKLLERKLPLEMGIARQLNVNLSIALEGRKIVRAPEDFEVEHKCFSYTRKATEQDGKLLVATQFIQRCHRLAAEDYPAFREAAQKVVSRARDSLTVGRKRGGKKTALGSR